MTLDDSLFELQKEKREYFIENNIITNYIENEKKEVDIKQLKKRIEGVVNKYVGQDIDALSVLGYAAEKGKMNKYMDKLEKHYKSNLSIIHPEARKIPTKTIEKNKVFFNNCYVELGIKPSKK